MGRYGGWSVHIPHSLMPLFFCLFSRRVLQQVITEDSRYRNVILHHILTYRNTDADLRHILTPIVSHNKDFKSCRPLWRTEYAHIFCLLSRRVLTEDSRYRNVMLRHILTPMACHKEDFKSCGSLWRAECAHTSQLSATDLLLVLAKGTTASNYRRFSL